MRTVVQSRQVQEDGEIEVSWVPRFGQFAIDCGFISLACWPYRPQQKGSVENLVAKCLVASSTQNSSVTIAP